MMQMRETIKRVGGWALLAGGITTFLAFNYLDSGTGIFLFCLGLLLLLADPVLLLLDRKDSTLEGRWNTLYLCWGLLVSAIVFYLIRDQIRGDEDSIAARMRLFLLILFLFSFAGAIILRISAGLEYSSRASLSGQQSREKNAVHASLAVLAALALFSALNYLAAVRNPTLDFSPGFFSYSADSRQIISSLDGKVEVHAFLPVKQAIRNKATSSTLPELFMIAEDVRVMLQQLPNINSKITLEFHNADLADFQSDEFGRVSNGTIIIRALKKGDVESDDRPYVDRRVYVFTRKDMERLERESVRALLQVSSPPRMVYFPAANGERVGLTKAAANPHALETFRELLRYYNYRIRDLGGGSDWPGPIPEDADAVVLAGPTVPYGEDAREALLDYAKRGGRLMILMDPAGQEDFEWLFQALQVPYKYERSLLSNNPRKPGELFIQQFEKHRMTENLNLAGRAAIIYAGSAYFEETKREAPPPGNNATSGEPPVTETGPAPGTPDQPAVSGPADEKPAPAPESGNQNGPEAQQPKPDEFQTQVFLYSPFGTVLDKNRNGKQDPGESSGRFPLGLAIENPATDARIAVYSDIAWISELGLRYQADHRNPILAADTLFWMTESQIAAALPAEPRKDRSIQITEELKLRNLILGMVIFPVGLSLILGLALYYYRRNRRFEGNNS
ncbi:MAG: Gldg family protein [Leptospiraceae bacterium]|nr:Gldg family protein [Leptospiraceae bacterium]